ncbi:methyltransferase domain-containing protein [Neolewinella aurantiaca]|uniref:Methyltransferase domain-containing protein n=1 Tax=Neolewinella aurantiaca TaxID=2602767 RepID=A0A5C7FQJ3_9BACT|nr:class I SAM-dependent methyltransferase [Neolewinella aurantiaca]TXF90095.1 methyltransferase domain-containing protein [Neolewinella aurantiaca]
MSEHQSILSPETEHPLSTYYKFQSRIYDLTRWSFLFGRRYAIRQIPFAATDNLRILEVGCGTGHNLVSLAERFPAAEITGIDLSQDMLSIARKKLRRFGGRVSIVHGAFGSDSFREQFDVVLFSYCLTMVNPGWDTLIEVATASLRDNGVLVAVDFHDSAVPAFKKHMAGHHVRMDGHVLAKLRSHLQEDKAEEHRAYQGVWRWFSFVGRRRS